MSDIQEPTVVRVRRFREGALLPQKSTAHAAGYDLHAWAMYDAAVTEKRGSTVFTQRDRLPSDPPPQWVEDEVAIAPGEARIIKTGLNVRIPAGYEIQVRPRSGLAAKRSVTVLNTPGTIDADYSGDGESFEVGVILINHGKTPFLVKHGERIAQMVVCKLPDVDLVEDFEDNVDRLGTDRVGGFGHTGV